jgi:dipeptidyl aminopeptidase/acylaminoacyl peptidase
MGRSLRFLLVLSLAALATAPTAQATYLGQNGKIAYDRDGAVWTMDPDGSNAALTINDANDPAWSADGRHLAYGCRLNSSQFSANVCTANPDGTSETVLDGFGGGTGQHEPTWSPDGLRLAIDTATGCSFHVCYSELWRINSADGGDPIRLEVGGASPSWSVNGLISYRPYSTSPSGGIRLVDPRLPGSSTQVPNTEGAALSDWSPDGQKLVFSLGTELYVIDRDGSNRVQLTNNSLNEFEPTWSPDGTRIAFVRYDGDYDIWVMNPDGTGETQLTDTPAIFEDAPAWQPAPQAGYVRPLSASPLRASLVPAFKPCTAPNRTHGPPLSFGSCAPPSQRAGFMTFGSAPSGASPTAVGYVRLGVIPGDPDSVNRADVKVSATLKDVRRGFDLADGPGSLELVLPVRITDQTNGPFDSEHQATVKDFDDYLTNPLRFLLPCTETADPAVGSTCSVSTTVNALLGSNPGAVRERRRAVWALDQLAVYDGGDDGYIESRDDNTVLAVQGLFVP